MRRHSWQPLVFKALSVDLMVTTAAPDALSFARIVLRLPSCGVAVGAPRAEPGRRLGNGSGVMPPDADWAENCCAARVSCRRS